MQEIILTFQGQLKTGSHVKKKFEYRRQFKDQLVRYRDHLIDDDAPGKFLFRPEDRKVVGPFKFQPLITIASRKIVDLDITLLTGCEPGCCKKHPTGDLDNYLKTLIDGLRMAQTMNEVRAAKPLPDEDPFHCLLEDDQQIRNINISHHRNYSAKSNKSGRGNEVFALIKVKICDKYCI